MAQLIACLNNIVYVFLFQYSSGLQHGTRLLPSRDANYEAKDILVEDCIFSGSMSPIIFVSVDGAVVRYDAIYRPTRWVIRIVQETRDEGFIPCRIGEFSNNLVVLFSDKNL